MSVVVRGSLDEIERETLAVLDVQRDEIHGDRLRGLPWFMALMQTANDVLRRRRAAEARRRVP